MERAFGRARGSRPAHARRGANALLAGLLAVAIVAALGGAGAWRAASAAAQVAAPDFPTAAVAPEDALAYVVFTLDQESEQWQLAADLLERAGLGGVLEQARDEALTDAAGQDLPLDAFLGGEIALVVGTDALEAAAAGAGVTGAGFEEILGASPEAAPIAPEAEATGAALVLDAQAPDTAFAGIQAALEDEATEAGTAIEETDYQGVTIQSVVGTDAEDGSTESFALARLDDLILLAAAPADLEPLIDAGQGATPALTGAAPFQDVRAELGEDYLLFGFFNGVAAREAQENLGDAATATLGVTGLGATDGYTGLLIRADEPGFRMETVTMAAEGEELSPAAANADSELVTRIPSDALFFLSAFDLGQTGFLDALGAGLIALTTGQLGAAATPAPDQTPEEFIAAQYEQAAALIGFNLQTDLFQQLVGEYALWISSGADPSSITALFASAVDDPGTVVNALQQLTLLIQGGGGGTPSVTTRQVDGSQVNVIDTGDPAVPDIEYGVVGEQLLIGLGDAIDDFVAGPGESLAENAQFQEVMATLPAERNGTLYVDLSQIIPLLQALAEADDGGTETADDEFAIEDASPDCADYADRAEAQAAYDAGEEGTFDLDQDFDGEVCEDFFGTAATPEPAPEADASPDDPAEIVAQADYSAIRAFALAAFDEAGMRRSSSILYIADDGAAPIATPVP